jgi:hypothetical protein
LFWGCNSSSSSSNGSGDSASVDTYADLANESCSSANAHEIINVKSTGTYYACVQVSSVWSWQPSVSTFSKLGDCSSANVGALGYVEQDKSVYMCVQNSWTDVSTISTPTSSANGASSGSDVTQSSNSSTTSSNSNTNTSSSGTSPTISSSAAATKVVTFVDGAIWIPSYGKRARTFFNTVDEYTFWSPNSVTKDSSGWWQKYNDDVDGGSSVTSGVFGSTYLTLNVTLNYGNWYKKTSGTSTYNAPDPYPYGGFQFDLSTASGGYSNISGWGGVCITYTSTNPFAFAVRSAQTDLGDGIHWAYGLDAASSPTTVEISFADLSRPTYATTTVTQAAALAKATGFQIAYRNDEAQVTCLSTVASACNSYNYSASNEIHVYKIAKAGTCGSSGGNTL